MNPIDVIEDLIKNKAELMDIFGEEYIAMTETIKEMFEVNGYRLVVEKMFSVKTETDCNKCSKLSSCEGVAKFKAQYSMYKSKEYLLEDNMTLNCLHYKE